MQCRVAGLSSVFSGARTVIQACPGTIGYFYVSELGLCTPLIWLPGISEAGITVFPSGDFYLMGFANPLYPQPFQPIQYDNDSKLACILRLTLSRTFENATSLCDSLGGHLVSVKTLQTLATIVDLAEGDSFWVGLDDLLEEGRYV
ncbi:hypothetical protein RRG08_018261 [Elysia crispata]|uniref:C-type lectin domain-containing protein n=1 Tax=Elysia crispata TaxID=231223 RepID=A0AAE1AXI1_9GAST|nr:hypothetical protein RRG08_018261 [Elysia crispata]